MMASLQASHVTSITIFQLICFGSVNSVFAWVPSHQQNIQSWRGRTNNGVYAAHKGETWSDESWENHVIRWVDDILEQKSEQCPFASESFAIAGEDIDKARAPNSVTYEWVYGSRDGTAKKGNEFDFRRNIALRTSGTPLLDEKSISRIRGAAEDLWRERQQQTNVTASSSRFTLQFEETNSECHLDELIASDASGELKRIVDTLLTQKVYPLVRSAFGSNGNSKENNHRHELTDGRLCVYDSLVVRYDGDKATDRFGASQPLHGDGGVISVNIALNSHREDDSEDSRPHDAFTGGGTFFEDLLQLDEGINHEHDNSVMKSNTNGPILRPSSTGHAIAHWSTHRHAGAPTTSGTRDILVIFLTQRKAETAPLKDAFPGIERSFHLKLKAREMPTPQYRDIILRSLDLAIHECPMDSQALFWKGFHLIQGRAPRSKEANTEEEERWKDLSESVDCFERAMICAPFDAKINCYAGIALRQRWMLEQKATTIKHEKQGSIQNNNQQGDLSRAASCLRRALFLHEQYREHGISSDFEDNAATAKLTLGEIYMQLEEYERAIECLSSIIEGSTDTVDEKSDASDAMKEHISKLIAHCHNEQREATEQKNDGASEAREKHSATV